MTGSSQGSSSSAKINVCADLPVSAAAQITGTTFTSAKPSNVENVVFGCDYHGPDSALLQVSVDTSAGPGAYSAGAAGFASFGALFGQTYIKIGGLTYVSASQGTKIANLTHGRM